MRLGMLPLDISSTSKKTEKAKKREVEEKKLLQPFPIITERQSNFHRVGHL